MRKTSDDVWAVRWIDGDAQMGRAFGSKAAAMADYEAGRAHGAQGLLLVDRVAESIARLPIGTRVESTGVAKDSPLWGVTTGTPYGVSDGWPMVYVDVVWDGYEEHGTCEQDVRYLRVEGEIDRRDVTGLALERVQWRDDWGLR